MRFLTVLRRGLAIELVLLVLLSMLPVAAGAVTQEFVFSKHEEEYHRIVVGPEEHTFKLKIERAPWELFGSYVNWKKDTKLKWKGRKPATLTLSLARNTSTDVGFCSYFGSWFSDTIQRLSILQLSAKDYARCRTACNCGLEQELYFIAEEVSAPKPDEERTYVYLEKDDYHYIIGKTPVSCGNCGTETDVFVFLYQQTYEWDPDPYIKEKHNFDNTGTCVDCGYAKPIKVIKPTGIALSSPDGEQFTKGGNPTTLSYVLKPANATSQVTFKSSDTMVATVDAQGKVTFATPNPEGKRQSKVTITATTANKKSAKITLNVTDPSVAESIAFEPAGTLGMYPGTHQLTVKLTPAGAASKVTWDSSKKSVATVSQDGLIEAKKPGTTVISAKTKNTKAAKITLVVLDPGEPTFIAIRAKDGTLYPNGAQLRLGEKKQLEVYFAPEGSSGKVSWSTSDAKSVSIDGKTGEITAKKATAKPVTITAKVGKLKAELKVNVVNGSRAVGIALNPRNVELKKGMTTNITATVALDDPNSPWAGNVVIKSLDQKIAGAKIEKTGDQWVISITGKESGETALTVRAINEDKSGVEASAKVAITDEDAIIKGKLDRLKGEFPEGSTWKGYYYGTQCNGFSRLVANRLFGTEGGWGYTSWKREDVSAETFKQLRPGDCLQYYYDTVRDPENPPTHTVVVYDTSKLQGQGYVTVLECNWGSPDVVRWTREINFAHVSTYMHPNNNYRWIRKHP